MTKYTCKFKHTSDKCNVNYVTRYRECARHHCNAPILEMGDGYFLIAGNSPIRTLSADLEVRGITMKIEERNEISR